MYAFSEMNIIIKSKYILSVYFILMYTFIVVKYALYVEDYAYYVNSFAFFLLFLFILYDKKIRNIFYDNIIVILLIVLGVIYIYIVGGINNADVGEYFVFYRRRMSPILLYFFVVFSKIGESKRFWSYFIVIVFIEFIYGVMQYYGLMGTRLEGFKIVNFSGTFLNNNSFGNLFAVIGVLGVYEYYSKKKMFRVKEVVFISFQLVVFVGIIASGVRTSIIAYTIGVFLVFIFIDNSRVIKKVETIGGFLLLILIVYIMMSSVIDKSFARIGEGISQIFEVRDFYNSYSTLAISYRLFEEGFGNIFFGEWRLFKDGYNVIVSGNTFIPIRENTRNFTDATFVLMIKEYGVIGAALFFMPYIYVLLKNKKRIINTISVVLLVTITVTDLGIFDPLLLGCSFWYLNTR